MISATYIEAEQRAVLLRVNDALLKLRRLRDDEDTDQDTVRWATTAIIRLDDARAALEERP